MQSLRISVLMWITLTIIFGVAYPAITTLVAQTVFPRQSQGSLIVKDNHSIGSRLVGQNFADPKYFWGRLSATGPVPYNAAASSGSNLSIANKTFLKNAKVRIDALHAADPANKTAIPVDLVTASASGLDPHISLAAAEYQAARVARVRGMGYDTIKTLVGENTQGRQWGVFGEPVVNVLTLNLAIDEKAKIDAQGGATKTP
ncbi:MAG: potassium-transporting ATPase subunit KdpC [bacterium]|nr:potassium-transporting ATPase subunit KdpC [bacterium]